jgi:hypothetical protein
VPHRETKGVHCWEPRRERGYMAGLDGRREETGEEKCRACPASGRCRVAGAMGRAPMLAVLPGAAARGSACRFEATSIPRPSVRLSPRSRAEHRRPAAASALDSITLDIQRRACLPLGGQLSQGEAKVCEERACLTEGVRARRGMRRHRAAAAAPRARGRSGVPSAERSADMQMHGAGRHAARCSPPPSPRRCLASSTVVLRRPRSSQPAVQLGACCATRLLALSRIVRARAASAAPGARRTLLAARGPLARRFCASPRSEAPPHACSMADPRHDPPLALAAPSAPAAARPASTAAAYGSVKSRFVSQDAIGEARARESCAGRMRTWGSMLGPASRQGAGAAGGLRAHRPGASQGARGRGVRPAHAVRGGCRRRRTSLAVRCGC